MKSDVGGHYFVSRRSIYRIHVTATFLLFLVAFMILIIGVMGGLYIYRQYARTQMHRFKTGWYSIPYDKSSKTPYTKDAVHEGLVADSNLIIQGLRRATEQEAMDIMKNIDSGLIIKGLKRTTDQEAADIAKNVDNIKSFFKERFEIDLENEHYEKIDVPDFRGGRQGRFVHDFNIVSMLKYVLYKVSDRKNILLCIIYFFIE